MSSRVPANHPLCCPIIERVSPSFNRRGRVALTPAHLGRRELILEISSVRLVAFVYAPPHLHALRLRFLAACLRAQPCKLSTRRIKARSTTRGSCSANNLAIQRSCSSLTLLVGRQGLARRAQLNFVLTFYLDLMVPIRGRDCTPGGEVAAFLLFERCYTARSRQNGTNTAIAQIFSRTCKQLVSTSP